MSHATPGSITAAPGLLTSDGQWVPALGARALETAIEAHLFHASCILNAALTAGTSSKRRAHFMLHCRNVLVAPHNAAGRERSVNATRTVANVHGSACDIVTH